MALAWASVKRYVKTNDSTFKLTDVHRVVREGVDRCTPEMWRDFTRHAEKEEQRFWEIDFVVEDILENTDSTVMAIVADTSDSGSKLESDSE